MTHGEVDLGKSGECPLVTMWSCDHVQISPYIKVTHGEIVLGIVVELCENAYNACT